MADGRAVAMNPDAVAGVLGPQTGPYQERFCQRAAVCDYKAADLASVADQLERLAADAAGLLGGRLDLSRLGSFGHSFGGNAALQWCRNDRRCRAAANAVAAGMATDAAAHAEKSITLDGWRTVRHHARPSYTLQVAGATHVSFMDVGLLPFRPRVPSGRCSPRPPSTRGGCGGSPATCSWPSSQPTSTRNRHRPCSRSRR